MMWSSNQPLAAAGAARLLERPHPLEIVEAAHFRAEQVDDDVVGVDQHPVGDRQALDADAAAELALDPLGELLAMEATWRVERPEAITI